jgi:hypothetical protein
MFYRPSVRSQSMYQLEYERLNAILYEKYTAAVLF